MWTIDQGKCMSCPKTLTCPDKGIIYRALRNMQNQLDETTGGSQAGLIIVVCRDPNIQ